jgi:hypothetical protein
VYKIHLIIHMCMRLVFLLYLSDIPSRVTNRDVRKFCDCLIGNVSLGAHSRITYGLVPTYAHSLRVDHQPSFGHDQQRKCKPVDFTTSRTLAACSSSSRRRFLLSSLAADRWIVYRNAAKLYPHSLQLPLLFRLHQHPFIFQVPFDLHAKAECLKLATHRLSAGWNSQNEKRNR